MRFLALALIVMLSGCVSVTITINGNGNTITINPTISPMSAATIPVSALPGLPGGL